MLTEVEILNTEFSPAFVEAMRNRMIMSYYKYGPIADAYPFRVNALECVQLRLKEYEKTGNTEWLIDAANFMMIEFLYPVHPDAHFRATDSRESPGRQAYNMPVPTQHSNGGFTKRITEE